MHVFGQLLHVEELQFGPIHYRVAMFKVQGGLNGQWSCGSCRSDDDHPTTHPGVKECVADLMKAIANHHKSYHEDGDGRSG